MLMDVSVLTHLCFAILHSQYSDLMNVCADFSFRDALSVGLLEIIAPSPNFYPDMNDIADRFGDTMERVK